MKVAINWLILCLLAAAPVSAQETALPVAEQTGWDVFIYNNEDDRARTLVFINMLTGEPNSLSVMGERFTLLGNAVLYYDLEEDQVKLAAPDASIQNHPLIRKSADAERIDWVLASDCQTIAWTETRRDSAGNLSTATYVSGLDSADSRELLRDGPRAGTRVLPIAFSAASNELIMEAHPDGISEHFPYTRYAGLFALNLDDGTLRALPAESGCYCAAGFGDRVMLRIAPSASGDSIEAALYNLEGSLDDSQSTVMAGALPDGFTVPSAALVSADDSLALYVLSQLPPLGEPRGETRSVFMLVNLQTFEQSLVSNPITGLAHAVAWTEDNGAVLFTNDQQLGTWKLRLSDGKITELASALYLGRIRG